MSDQDHNPTMTNQTKEQSPVIYDYSEGIATITLNRPKAMNAMTPALMQGISDAMANVVANQDVRVVVLTGAGRGFCAGADLADVAEETDGAQEHAQTPDQTQASDDAPSNQDVYNNAMRALMDSPVPTIARVQGPAAGGGFGLALACDITIAAHSAFFVATFGPKLGIVPDMGATWNIPLRVGRARSLGITLLGDRISAAQAEAWGLIWRAVSDDNLDQEVKNTAEQLKRSSPGTVSRIRQTIDAAIHHTFSDQLDLEMTHQAVLIPRNMREGAVAFMEKREPTFSGDRD